MNDAVGIRGVTRAALAGPTKNRRHDVWAGVACDISLRVGWLGNLINQVLPYNDLVSALIL